MGPGLSVNQNSYSGSELARSLSLSPMAVPLLWAAGPLCGSWCDMVELDDLAKGACEFLYPRLARVLEGASDTSQVRLSTGPERAPRLAALFAVRPGPEQRFDWGRCQINLASRLGVGSCQRLHHLLHQLPSPGIPRSFLEAANEVLPRPPK